MTEEQFKPIAQAIVSAEIELERRQNNGGAGLILLAVTGRCVLAVEYLATAREMALPLDDFVNQIVMPMAGRLQHTLGRGAIPAPDVKGPTT